MSEYQSGQLVQLQITPQQQAVVQPVQPPIEQVPSNVHTLSTGIRVQFLGKLPATVSQNLVVNIFSSSNLEGGRVVENLTPEAQLKLAYSMFQYTASLVLMGLSEGVLKVYDGLPKNSSWLKTAKINPIIEKSHPNLDWNEPMHQEFVYLLYTAFKTEKDMELLSEQLLQR
jgi:hypothetical protein